MSQVHAIVWLDHLEATIVSFSLGSSNEIEVHSHSPERHIHHKAGSIGSGHAADDHHFFDEIIAALAGIHEVLIAGPGNAKTAFQTYIEDHDVELAQRVVGIETLDHPTEPELLAHARKYFTAVDQLGLTEESR
jgi:stalled ribosome rescue protein Dom34